MILTSGLSYRPCWIIQKSQKCLFQWSKQPKMRFLVIFLSLVHWIYLILHILIELNGLHALASVSVMLGHSKTTKMPFWMIQIAKNKLLGRFLEFRRSDWLEIAYYHRNEQCAGLANIVFDLLNSPDCPFWMIQIAKNEFPGLIELNSVHE